MPHENLDRFGLACPRLPTNQDALVLAFFWQSREGNGTETRDTTVDRYKHSEIIGGGVGRRRDREDKNKCDGYESIRTERVKWKLLKIVASKKRNIRINKWTNRIIKKQVNMNKNKVSKQIIEEICEINK